MTEYGVQTNNLFDLLNVADEAKPAAPKPKNRRKKRGSAAAGQAPASGQPGQGAKPAGSPAPKRGTIFCTPSYKNLGYCSSPSIIAFSFVLRSIFYVACKQHFCFFGTA